MFAVSDSTLPPEAPRRVVLGLMAKFWTAGNVKTRLGKTIGMHQSARLHKLFVTVLTNALADAADGRVAVVTPPQKEKRFASQISDQWTTSLQSDGDLGDRMMHWFQQSLGDHSVNDNSPPLDAAVLIGADCPLIDPATIESAAVLLGGPHGEPGEGHDVVLGPAMDGGYYLIGLRGPWHTRYEKLFRDMTWSSEDVLDETVRRCQASDLTFALLDQREDIDTIDSLNRLRSELKSRESSGTAEETLATQIEAILDDPWEDDAMPVDSPSLS